MPSEGFTSVGIPTELYEGLVKYVKNNPELGYTGVPDLVRDILRDIIRPPKAVLPKAKGGS